MTVLIKNIEQPKDNSCSYCFFYRGYSCGATPPDKTTERDKGYICRQFVYPEGIDSRPEWCPLVEIPEPHGRLIDADFMKELGAKCIAKRCDDGVLLALGRIDDLPTVIEAEE